MYQLPEELVQETGDSLVYCPKRVLVSKEFTFDAAHHLFAYDGKCQSLHGHTYRLQVAITGFLDERGLSIDFGDLKSIYQKHLEPLLDHRYLNEKLPYMNPTAENMVYWIYKVVETYLPKNEQKFEMAFVRLFETPTAYAEFRKEWDA